MSLFRTLLSQLSRLPSEYQEVEWIKGDGASFIDLELPATGGILCDEEVEHNSDFTSLDVDGGGAIAAHNSQYPYGRCTGYYKAGAHARELGYGETFPEQSDTLIYDHKYHLVWCTFYDEAYFEADGVRKITTSGQNVTSTNVYLFGSYWQIVNPPPTYSKTPILRFYNGKIYKKVDGVLTLMRDLVPCYRKANNEIGVYDLVTQKFYGNIGTGKFRCYPTPPRNYTKLDYLESTGTQYINTGFSATYLTKIDIDFQYTSNTTNGKTRVFGSRRTWKSRGFYGGTDNDAMGEKYWYLIGTLASDSSFRPASINSDTNKHNLVLNKDGGYIDNVLVWTPVNTPTSFTAYSSIALFGAFEGTTPVIQTGICRIYECKIYDNDVLVRDLIPVLDETNVPCMYDKLNDEFYYNAGSGTFLYQ